MKFLKDIKGTFAILGNAISGIGLIVACITIFIVIFVNAITRRRFIGILKGIGINKKAILYSYMMQAMIYAFMGIIIGMKKLIVQQNHPRLLINHHLTKLKAGFPQ